MNITESGTQRIAMLALAGLLVATRAHFFAPLPDATLAVFFVAGLLGAGTLSFVGLLGTAAAADYVAITFQGAGDWCITPAYAFLAPTYACLWLAGKFSRGAEHSPMRTWLVRLGALAVSVCAAFLVSNAGFYLFAGYFAQISPFEYSARVLRYFPGYASNAFVYVVAGAALYALWAYRKPALSTPRT
jgi:hypothetical protein